MANEAAQILIADSHPLCRQGLTTVFTQNLGLSNLAEALDFPSVMAKIAAQRSIGFVTIDLGLPGMRKREGLRDLRVKYPEVQVVVVTASRDREMVLDALGAGAHGYIPKDLPVHEMADALQKVLAGQIYVPPFLSDLNVRKTSIPDEDGGEYETALTGRQLEVLSLLAAGRSNKEIARLLCIAEGTVKVHIAAAFRMLGVHNRVSAVAVMQARAFDDGAAETYLPGLIEVKRERSISQRNFSGLSRIAYRR
ncbi:MAG TPA: response regulator transcription factor [Sphingopyxis sp.]|nr:response regulator transcription factor [Sphingopyxis sp.]